ncbi:MAG: type II toxin-antitoxin system RelE/ParE family toxin [Verrucomicrobiota bacterium]
MNFVVHPKALLDYDEILAHLEEVLMTAADRFEAGFKDALQKALNNPFHFHFANRSRLVRRANIKKFSRHFLYSVDESQSLIRVLAFKHDHQHPDYGFDRECS